MARQAVIPQVQDMAPAFGADRISSLPRPPKLLRAGAGRQRGDLDRQSRARSRDPLDQDVNRIANLAVATSESWRDRVSGERKERTEWHRVVIFN